MRKLICHPTAQASRARPLGAEPALRRLAIAAEPKSAEVVPHGLVSQHRDGRFIGDPVMRLGFRMV